MSVNVEKRAKVVRDRNLPDLAIQAPRARRGCKHVPERDSMLDQGGDPTRILGRQVWNPSRDDLPEGVLGIGVVLPTFER
jgi:hypothetical protein